MALKDAIVLEWIDFKKGKHIHVFSFIPFSNNMCLHPLLLHVFCLCICIAFESAPGLILGRIFSSLGDPDGVDFESLGDILSFGVIWGPWWGSQELGS